MAGIFEHPEGTSLGEMGIDRILTAPNVITTVRLFLIPVFVYLLLGRDSPGWAGFTLGCLASTDWIDGYVARRFDQRSNFGKMYDPFVDRLLMATAIVSIIVYGKVPLWYCWTILIREVLLSIWVVAITALGAKRMNVTWWGKVGTFANMLAFPFFLFAEIPTLTDSWHVVTLVIAYGAAVPGVVFSLLAAWQYIGLGREALIEGRAERIAGAG